MNAQAVMRFYCPCVFIFHRKSGLQIVLAVRRPGDADYSDWAEQGGFMKLQTRIMVGFFMIILVPLLLFAATLHGMREAQIREEKKAETAETVSAEHDYGYGITIADSETGQDGIQIMTKDLFVSALVILVFTSLSVGLWIYRSIATPLVKLRKATRNIKDGNLDFVLDVEGTDEFSELCRDFEEMRRRLKESAEEKIILDKENKELISNISHDLKTPITAVKGYVEGIMDGVADTPEKMDRYVRTIYNKTNEMDHLINELTFYSKIDTNRIPYTFSKLNVEDYFSDCAEEIGLELETRGIQLCYANYVDRSVQVIADGEQIRRVIHNIIGNAIKYMDKAKGVIQIRVKDVGDFVQVEIEDNGKGIASKDLAYIFDRFYRTDVSRNSSKGGSGIGLSIVKKIMEDHGGKVWATSREGIGTIMYFVLRKYQEVPMK
jgi:signal transduction histidine kinase